MYLAFYIAEHGTLVKDKFVDKYTGGYGYSHVELVRTLDMKGNALCYSSSPRDGGVRAKIINLKSGHWVVVELDDIADTTDVDMKFHGTEGCKYDWVGVLAGQGLGARLQKGPIKNFVTNTLQSEDKWFCSEYVTYLLGEYHCVSVNELAECFVQIPPAKLARPFSGMNSVHRHRGYLKRRRHRNRK